MREQFRMWKDMMRVAFAASLWVTSIAMMIVATAESRGDLLVGWSVLLGMGGSVFVVWQMLANERHRVETIAKLLSAREPAKGLREVERC